ncbi:MAG: hypothetical protein ACI4I9_08980 [Porcipelethomonas sp.]
MTEEILLVTAVSVDAFLAAFVYGAGRIKIPFFSAVIISGVGTAALVISMLLSELAGAAVPHGVCRWLGFLILSGMGTLTLFQNALKSMLRKRQRRKLSFSISGVGFVISVFLDETCADADKSKTLSPGEALALAAALSADSLGSGFGAGLGGADIFAVGIMSLAAGLAAVEAGAAAGRKTGAQRPGVAWISGVFLIILAVMSFVK